MDKKEFALFASALRTYYPKEKLLPNTQAMELWFMQLQDIPYQVAEATLNKWVVTNKWSPSIAEIREISSSMINGDIPDWGEGWEQVLKAIKKYGSYNIKGAMESFDPITKKCVERLGFKNICMSENLSVERANFRMMYETYAERKKMDAQIPANLMNRIAEIRQEKLTIETKEGDK